MLAGDALGGRAAVGAGRSEQVVAGSAGQAAVAGQLFLEKQASTERHLGRRGRVVGRGRGDRGQGRPHVTGGARRRRVGELGIAWHGTWARYMQQRLGELRRCAFDGDGDRHFQPEGKQAHAEGGAEQPLAGAVEAGEGAEFLVDHQGEGGHAESGGRDADGEQVAEFAVHAGLRVKEMPTTIAAGRRRICSKSHARWRGLLCDFCYRPQLAGGRGWAVWPVLPAATFNRLEKRSTS